MKSLTSLSSTIKLKLQKIGVTAVYLFGSHSEGVASNLSDVDIAVLMKNATQVSPRTSTTSLYQRLYEILSIEIKNTDLHLDIVFLQRASLELQTNVVLHSRIIYSNDESFRLDYQERVLRLYADFRILKQEFDKAIIERI